MSNISYNGSEITISEESGWTDYLVDFSENQKLSSISSSSLISDAGNNNNYIYNNNPILKRLNFKNPNKKNNFSKKNSYDEDLEDTASSPVNSPKVSTMKHMDVNYRKSNGVTFGDIMGKHEAGSSYFSGLSREEKNGNNMINDSINHINGDFVDLKTRGLCLVPISAFVNYIQ